MFYTPLRYPGGKGKLADYIKLLFEENNLFDGHYVEPYAGGAGVAVELLLQEYASHIYINDIDDAVYAFWYSVLNYTDELSKMISSTRVSMAAWERQKDVLNNPKDYSKLEKGFATFFLNRTNRSGILKGGVIGGKAQSGKWKLDVRYNKKNLIQRIEQIALYKNRISLYRKDALLILTNLIPKLPKNTLIYLDPPYYVKGEGLYRNYYNHEDHVSIKRALRKTKNIFWLVSYDNVNEIKDIYKPYRYQEYSLSYTAQNKFMGSEVMIYGPRLKYPEDIMPYTSPV
ncbi:MAG: DNA adenine methylase [Gammaproteobacteria bacterium]|nr:DNA adenine methylase [Gammaproteobacteria bacterium]